VPPNARVRPQDCAPLPVAPRRHRPGCTAPDRPPGNGSERAGPPWKKGLARLTSSGEPTDVVCLQETEGAVRATLQHVNGPRGYEVHWTAPRRRLRGDRGARPCAGPRRCAAGLAWQRMTGRAGCWRRSFPITGLERLPAELAAGLTRLDDPRWARKQLGR